MRRPGAEAPRMATGLGGRVMDPSVKSAVMSSAPDPPSADGWPRLVVGRWLPSWAVSFVVHLVLICLLAFITIPPSVTETIVVSGVEEALPEPFEDEPVVEDQIEPSEEMTLEDAEPALESAPVELEDTVSTEFDDAALAAPSMEVVDLSHKFVPKVNWSKELGAIGGRGLEGRGAAARQRMVREAGGSAGSEAAVARGLAWLAGHQRPDGGWALDHRMAGCRGACTHPGDLDARIAATGLALLPFLGAGHTHQQGKYKAVVARGLDYLLRRQRTRGQVGDWRDAGNMYSHGIATIAVCEAYAMTRDPRLARPAQRALNFIVFAQDPVVGGWRYQPRQPGDTSVTGWQIMALKSGHMAYLIVPGTTVGKADRFLTAVQTRGGARYGYAGPGEAASTTAIGLLCRMYMGWQHDHEA
ncbi:MAG TPA: hypothetical protein ENJ62_02610, partial [Bryobacterales bacterium]|nr:hypothetical protein [Bryobacterales bacterium]